MPDRTATEKVTGALHRPVTREGQALLERVTEALPIVRDGAAAHDRDGTLAAEPTAAWGASGALGGTVPVELGGLGVTSLYDVAVVLAKVAEAHPSTAL